MQVVPFPADENWTIIVYMLTMGGILIAGILTMEKEKDMILILSAVAGGTTVVTTLAGYIMPTGLDAKILWGIAALVSAMGYFIQKFSTK